MTSGIYTRTEEMKKHLSLVPRGVSLSEEHKKQIGLGNKGKIRTEEAKINYSMAKKGKKLSKEHKRKISESHKKLGLTSEKVWNWKGDKAGRVPLHNWVKKNKYKLEFCEECHKKRRLVLANLKNHKYTRNPEDYKWLCYSCHRKLDFPKKLNKKN